MIRESTPLARGQFSSKLCTGKVSPDCSCETSWDCTYYVS